MSSPPSVSRSGSRHPRPLVTIGLPVFDGEAFVARALDAIQAQTVTDLEILVGDNGSTDATPDICDRYARADARIRVLRSDVNRGAAWNFNRLARAATGVFFKWAPHDDRFAPTYLERMLELLERSPAAVLAHSRSASIDGDDRVTRQWEPDEDVGMGDPVARFRAVIGRQGHPCSQVVGLVRREVLLATGLIGPFASSDLVLIAELALHGPFARTDDVLLYRRDHEAQSMQAYDDHRSRAAWFDPSRDAVRTYPYARHLREFARVIRRSPITPRERIRCRLALGPWTWTYRDPLAREAARAVLGGRGRREWTDRRAYRRDVEPASGGP